MRRLAMFAEHYGEEWDLLQVLELREFDGV